jgi:hypothetical protein
MPTPTYTPLANATVSVTAASITFSNIPATYRDLVLSLGIRSTYALGNDDYLKLTFNGDTGNNYNYLFMNGSGTAATSGSNSNVAFISDSTFSTSTAASGIFTPVQINIQDYSATDKHKTTVSRSSASTTGLVVSATAGRWANTAAVNSITLTCFQAAATFAAGSTFSLYGIAS